MSKNVLGRVAAGAALTGACLFGTAAGVAAAPAADGDSYGHKQNGVIKVLPQWVEPGHKVKILQLCYEQQEHAWAWSKVTGNVKLWPVKGHKFPQPLSDVAEPDGTGSLTESDGSVREETLESNANVEPQSALEDDSAVENEEESGNFRMERTEPEAGDFWSESDSAESEEGSAWSESDSGWSKKDRTWSQEGRAEVHKDGVRGEQNDQWAESEPQSYGKDGYPTKGYKDGKKLEGTHQYWGTAEVPWSAEPGAYDLKGSCAYGKLWVKPNGPVEAGEPGSTNAHPGLLLGGAGALAAAGVGGLLMLRRRLGGGVA